MKYHTVPLRNTPLLIAFFVMACDQAAFAQAPTGTYSLSGTVLNSVTGEPVTRALVQLQGFHPSSENPPGRAETATAFTDPSGAFRFDALEAGQYSIFARKPGFATDPGNFQQSLIELTASKDSIPIRLAPLGVITGRIADQDGTPARSIDVIALRIAIVNGERQKTQAASTKTDDRGIFRFAHLNPGRYYVRAAGLTGGTSIYAAANPSLSGLDEEGFRPVYAGGAAQLESATPVQVEPGTEARADITLKFEKAFKIRGSLTGFVPRRTASFELLSRGETAIRVRAYLNGDSGTFEIQDVVPGVWLLRVTQGETRGEAAVQISGGDIEGLAVALAPPVAITVVTRFANSPPAPAPNSNPPGSPDGGFQRFVRGGGGCNASLHPVADAAPVGGTIPGNRSAVSVFPGSYNVRVNCFSSYPTSVLSGTNDLLVNPVLTVAPGELPPPIEITALYGGATISGTISSDLIGSAQTSIVLAVPRTSGGAGPVIAMVMRQGAERSDLPFQFRGLAPGAYTIWAIPNATDVPYREPAFLQSLTGGLTVEADEKSEKKITLTEVVK